MKLPCIAPLLLVILVLGFAGNAWAATNATLPGAPAVQAGMPLVQARVPVNSLPYSPANAMLRAPANANALLAAPLKDADYISVPADEKTSLLDEPAFALDRAAKDFHAATGKKLKVTSTSRTLNEQATLFYDNCLENGGVCSPPTCDVVKDPSILYRDPDGKYSLKGALEDEIGRAAVIKALAAHGKENNCAHTSKVAVDAWCEGSSDYQSDPSCMEKLAQIMMDNGFCRLSTEAWHFEWNAAKVSSGCSQGDNSSYLANGTAIDPEKGGCALWDYQKNKCLEYRQFDRANGTTAGTANIPKACYGICGIGLLLDSIFNPNYQSVSSNNSTAGGLGGACLNICAALTGGNNDAVNATKPPPLPQPEDFCKTAKCSWWEVCDSSSKKCIPKDGFDGKEFDCETGYSLGEDGYCHPQDSGGGSNNGDGGTAGGEGNGWGGQIKIGPDGEPIYPGNQQCLSYTSCQDCTKAAQSSSWLAGCQWFPDSGTCIGMEGGIDKAENCDAGKAGAGGGVSKGGTPAGGGKKAGTITTKPGGGGTSKKAGAGGQSKKFVCPAGYVPDQYNLCFPECGANSYCAEGQCYNGECLVCDSGSTLGTDGLCYPDKIGEKSTCPQGYVPGDDGLCHPECGQDTYCTGDAVCYYGQCLVCEAGYYLGTDGQCYAEEGGIGSCPIGYVPGDDDLCHEECGIGTDTYCTGDSQCYSGQCIGCEAGYYLGTDGWCYSEKGEEDESPCPQGYVPGDDGYCHEECGAGTNTYCTGDSQCYSGECLSCAADEYLGTDGNCYPENGGQEFYCDDPGFVLGVDNLCHPECGYNTYCAEGAQCYSGQCIGCEAGYYLGRDGQCYAESGGDDTGICPEDYYDGGDGYCYSEDEGACFPGFLPGDDGQCHKACGFDFYCINGAACINGECYADNSGGVCPDGYYDGGDGYCYPDSSGDTCQDGYYDGGDGYCYPDDTGGICQEGYYDGGDGYCYPDNSGYVCPDNFYDGGDGYCYPEDGGGECPDNFYDGGDGYCYPDNSGDPCPSGYYDGGDGYCYPDSSGGTCEPGYYDGGDGYCYPNNGGGGGGCDPDYIPGDDGYCHQACGADFYCTGDSICYNGQCLSCNPGYYLGNDGNCYSESGGGGGCPSGYYDGGDGYCYPENSGITCPSGYYDGGDGYCYPNDGGGSGELECPSGMYQVSDTWCCPYGTYYATDGQCYYE